MNIRLLMNSEEPATEAKFFKNKGTMIQNHFQGFTDAELFVTDTHLNGHYTKTSLMLFKSMHILNIDIMNISEARCVNKQRFTAVGTLWLVLISFWLVAWFVAVVAFSYSFWSFVVSGLCFLICGLGTFQGIMRMTTIGSAYIGGWGFNHRINGNFHLLKQIVEAILEKQAVLSNYETSFEQFQHLTYKSLKENSLEENFKPQTSSQRTQFRDDNLSQRSQPVAQHSAHQEREDELIARMPVTKSAIVGVDLDGISSKNVGADLQGEQSVFCSSCNHDNLPTNNFCGMCGAKLET